MGWLNPEQQEEARKKFKVRAFYLCDVCDKPILGLVVIDPRKGYHHWPKRTLPGVRALMGREPRWTSCYDCDKQRRDGIKHKKERKQRKFLRVVSKVLEVLKRKSYSKERLVRKLRKHERSVVLRAIRTLVKERTLKKREGKYSIRRKQ